MPRKTDPWMKALQKAFEERVEELDLLREHDLKGEATRPSSD